MGGFDWYGIGQAVRQIGLELAQERARREAERQRMEEEELRRAQLDLSRRRLEYEIEASKRREAAEAEERKRREAAEEEERRREQARRRYEAAVANWKYVEGLVQSGRLPAHDPKVLEARNALAAASREYLGVEVGPPVEKQSVPVEGKSVTIPVQETGEGGLSRFLSPRGTQQFTPTEVRDVPVLPAPPQPTVDLDSALQRGRAFIQDIVRSPTPEARVVSARAYAAWRATQPDIVRSLLPSPETVVQQLHPADRRREWQTAIANASSAVRAVMERPELYTQERVLQILADYNELVASGKRQGFITRGAIDPNAFLREWRLRRERRIATEKKRASPSPRRQPRVQRGQPITF